MREIRERSLSSTVRACTMPLIFGLVTGTAITQGIDAAKAGDYLLVGGWATLEVCTGSLARYNASVEICLENSRLWWNDHVITQDRRDERIDRKMAEYDALKLQNP